MWNSAGRPTITRSHGTPGSTRLRARTSARDCRGPSCESRSGGRLCRRTISGALSQPYRVRPEKRVYNYLLRIVANREGALADPARFAPWLYRIAHNEAYSLFRKRRPEGETEELQPETLEGAATFGGNAVFPVELTLAVSGALRKLSADRQPDDSLISYARGRGRGRGIDESRYVAPTGKPDSRKRSDCRAKVSRVPGHQPGLPRRFSR